MGDKMRMINEGITLHAHGERKPLSQHLGMLRDGENTSTHARSDVCLSPKTMRSQRARAQVRSVRVECEEAWKWREERKKHKEEENVVFQRPLRRESSISLVMVLLIEGGLAEEPRATFGCAGGKGHCLQHCIENNRDNSQGEDKTNTIKEKQTPTGGLALVSTKQIPNNSIRKGRGEKWVLKSEFQWLLKLFMKY